MRFFEPDTCRGLTQTLYGNLQRRNNSVFLQRDRAQAMAVGKLVVEHLPQYRLDASELRMFPQEVVQKAADFFHLSL